MVKNQHCEQIDAGCALEAARLRRQADALLQQLVSGREQCEQRLADTGRRDAIKCVTGRSALDDAIATTRTMIEDMDNLLYEADGVLHAELQQQSTSIALMTGTSS